MDPAPDRSLTGRGGLLHNIDVVHETALTSRFLFRARDDTGLDTVQSSGRDLTRFALRLYSIPSPRSFMRKTSH